MDELFEIDGDGALTLLGGWAPTCGLHHFPLAPVCPYSGADDVETVRLPRTATLWAWTAVTAPPAGYDGPVPYGFGVVELVNGAGPTETSAILRIVTRLTEADPARLTFGQPMIAVADTLADGVTTWTFAPADLAGDPA